MYELDVVTNIEQDGKAVTVSKRRMIFEGEAEPPAAILDASRLATGIESYLQDNGLSVTVQTVEPPFVIRGDVRLG